jgi:hypothetical protein
MIVGCTYIQCSKEEINHMYGTETKQSGQSHRYIQYIYYLHTCLLHTYSYQCKHRNILRTYNCIFYDRKYILSTYITTQETVAQISSQFITTVGHQSSIYYKRIYRFQLSRVSPISVISYALKTLITFSTL